MAERRARGTRAGRPSAAPDRRASRAARSRPRADTDTAARPTAAKRARRRADSPPKVRKTEPRKTSRADRHERTILGLPTGKAVILAVVVCALALTLAVPMRTYFSQRAEAAELAQQRRNLEADLDRLRNRRAQQQDQRYIISEARNRLRLVMPGETPYIVQVPGIEAPAPPPAPTQSKTPDPWYTELWETISQPQTPATEPVPTPAPAAPPPADSEGPR
ncbi:septum formation initiator family protein [Nocardia sp. XZ_19_385]|uniref:FtsB family cell division protein n=1 Tax=Nocardia sp. XZ_19_385 TaxID=2769488 RepID=UPI00188E1410|nr:septum formation initiator family protein [Nocardia sp. XZ_19_385]